jgi:hypothetical protein
MSTNPSTSPPIAKGEKPATKGKKRAAKGVKRKKKPQQKVSVSYSYIIFYPNPNPPSLKLLSSILNHVDRLQSNHRGHGLQDELQETMHFCQYHERMFFLK